MAHKIRYVCTNREVSCDEHGRTVLDISIANGIPHWRECGGHGRCTTCRVRILDGMENVSPRTPREQAMAAARGWDAGIRLGCQVCVHGDVTLERLVQSGSDTSQLQVEMVDAEAGSETELAILFCDMRDFTPFVESHSSYDVVHILNRLFSTLGEPILLNNGIIYQYVGDEITGLFGLDGAPPERSCRNAVRAALAMVDGLEALNQTLSAEFGIRVDVGIGIHYGAVVAGRIGHPIQRQFSVVGDSINAASRIQGLTRSVGGNILLSDKVVEVLPPDALQVGMTTEAPLRGKLEKVKLFEVTGFSEADPFLIAQLTIDRLLAEPNAFSSRFYDRVFTVAPELRQLFRGNMGMQGQMLEHMLRGIVYALGRPEHLALGLHSLGHRHVAYGVTDAHYDAIREPLLDTIGEILGADYTPPVARAWEHAIDLVLRLMRRGAKGGGAAAPPEIPLTSADSKHI